MTEVNPLTQNTEYDEVPSTIHYINSVSCDMTPLSQTASVDQRHQQTNLFNFIPSTHEEPPQKHEGNIASKRATSGGSGVGTMGTSSNVFGNIPFVQIHTSNVQPQRTSYGNVFRRNISKQEEIKSEPIKYENAEAAKDRTNATPTPPRTASQTQNENNMEALATNEKQTTNLGNNNFEEKSCSFLQIYKCSKCPFISLRDTERNDHISAQHAENGATKSEQRQPINCPGKYKIN